MAQVGGGLEGDAGGLGDLTKRLGGARSAEGEREGLRAGLGEKGGRKDWQKYHPTMVRLWVFAGGAEVGVGFRGVQSSFLTGMPLEGRLVFAGC